MEHHAQSVGDGLTGGLNYKLRPGASYVTDRRSVTFSQVEKPIFIGWC